MISFRVVAQSSLVALLLVAFSSESFGQAERADRASLIKRADQANRDKKAMSEARKKRKAVFSKRHNMRDPKTRKEVVRQLKEAEDELRAAVHRQARARGLAIEGENSNGGRFRLIDFDKKGTPIYEEDQNLDAAITTAADEVRDNPIYQSSAKVEAEVAYPSNHSGVQLETCTDTGGGQNVAYIENGDWCEYTIDVPTAGQYAVNIRTASNNNDGGTINLSLSGSSIGSIDVPDTNGWQNWTTVRTQVVFAAAGTQTLRMDFSGGAGSLFNVNWFSFNRSVIIGHWESGTARLTHRELSGKVTIMDGSSSTSNHATHVAGTLVSRGINPDTLGMAPEASIAAFSSSGATSEMMANGAAAPNTTDIHLSNHSYGSTRGWRNDGGWEWKGEYSEGGNQEDFYDENFGRYNGRSEDWDNIAYSLPYYLIFVSAGNARENVPSPGDSWTYQDGFSTVTVPSYDPAIHPLSNRYYKGDSKGYDTMEGGGLAKNAIAVGSSDEGIDGSGNRDPGFATAQSYSCRGPADDGRIKPDIHGNGTGLTSSIASSDTATASYGGTSMSSPNVCGSAALLVGYYGSRFPGEAMRASTLKALILHTADDRGKAGPDYKYGWGVMNAKTAADVIKMHADGSGGAHMLESTVDDATNTSRTHSFIWDGSSPLRVTLCWTDPASEEIEGHDNRTKALVNDLNLKVTGPGGTHLPYVMPYVGDWANAKFESSAVPGVNDVDPIEQVYLKAEDVVAGTYTVTVDYAGSLTNDSQDYSLIVTGQAAAEIEVEEIGPPVEVLTDNSGVQDFGARAPSEASVVKTYTVRNTGGSPLTGLAITKSGVDQDDFSVSALSAVELEAGQTASFTVTYDPLGLGTRTAALQLASNDADEAQFDINLSAIGLSELEAWRFEHFGTTANTGEAADDFDYDKDGLVNLVEFGLATIPTVAEPNPILFELNGAQVELTYPRSVIAMNDYIFEVIWEDELPGDSWSTAGVTEEILSDNGVVQQVKATIPMGIAARRFFCVRMSPK